MTVLQHDANAQGFSSVLLEITDLDLEFTLYQQGHVAFIKSKQIFSKTRNEFVHLHMHICCCSLILTGTQVSQNCS